MRPENLSTSNTLHNHLKGLKNIPRTMGLMKDGKGRLADWQSLVKVCLRVWDVSPVLSVLKFTFHAAMLRDSLSELHRAGEVEVVKKVDCIHLA